MLSIPTIKSKTEQITCDIMTERFFQKRKQEVKEVDTEIPSELYGPEYSRAINTDTELVEWIVRHKDDPAFKKSEIYETICNNIDQSVKRPIMKTVNAKVRTMEQLFSQHLELFKVLMDKYEKNMYNSMVLTSYVSLLTAPSSSKLTNLLVFGQKMAFFNNLTSLQKSKKSIFAEFLGRLLTC